MTAAIEIVEQSSSLELAEPATAVELVETTTAVVLSGDDADLELVEQSTTIELGTGATIELVEQVTVLELGATALQGPPGASAADDLTYPAAVTISGQRVVLYSPADGGWIYADRTIPTHAGAQLAVSLGAIDALAAGDARLAGILDEPTWTWPAPCPLYLDAAGALTATPPTSGFLREVARAITSTRIAIDPQPAVILF